MSDAEQLPATSTASEANTLRRKRWRALIEVVVVLAIIMPQYDGWTTPDRVSRWISERPFPADHNVATVVFAFINIAAIVILIRLGHEPWSAFGIKRLNGSVDILSGCLTFACDYVFGIIGVDVFLQLLKDGFGKQLAHQLDQQSWDVFANSPSSFLAIVGFSIAIGVSEELVMRGFLLTRLERITSRTWLSVFITAVIFGCAHSNGGIVLVWNAFLSGLICGASFVLTRSLWPPVIAHVMLDFVVFSI